MMLSSVRLVSSAMQKTSSAHAIRTVLIQRPRTTLANITKPYVKKQPGQQQSRALSGSAKEEEGWWHSAKFWGACGAIAGWGMSGAAIYDAYTQSAEIISPAMTGVLIVYSSLFARWAFVVKPQNLLLCACHVTNVAAQVNQLRRCVELKTEQGKMDEVNNIYMSAGGTLAAGLGSVILGPTIQSAIVSANLPAVSAVAAADAGPFTVHFWAPMSKWFISGASFLDLNRPTEKISIAQYTALTLTGFFFSRYALLVTPINYTLCSVNVALFGSSAWHLGRKINADFIEGPKEEEKVEAQ
uniref:Mitochondrial pyruvate carrier n=1 Tax=Ditylum brightwellii TaxID=49249 RepID=A0A6V2PUL3_9STRA|mmetsp:Transcript_21427/g.31036  ORF Transcript_21427/g.31036 Transcript_21427/m.31036 type:complete len:299 (-) Transcript_21427:137-1033(-)